jgi:hypothetical protein
MQDSEDYKNFLARRVSTALNKRFVSFSFDDYIGSYVTPADGYYTYKAKLRHSKGGALTPTYNLWSNEKITSHLSQILKARYAGKKESLKAGGNS